MKKLLLLAMMLFFTAMISRVQAANEIDIGIYATTCSDFEVRLSSQFNITNTSLTNVQFAIKYPASVTIGDLNYLQPVGLQYTTIEGSFKYSVFVGENISINNWVAGTQYGIIQFSTDHAASSTLELIIGNDSWTSGNNAMYYAELLGIDKTGAILTGASVDLRVHNIDLERYYCRIQEGIDDAGTGGETIEVSTGTFAENVIINKTGLTLINAASVTPVIDGSNTGTVVTISANNVTLQGFKIQNSGATAIDAGVILRNDGVGGVTGCSVTGNEITSNANGLGVILGSGNSITSNDIHNNSEYGILLIGSNGNTIEDNEIYIITKDAIALDNLAALTSNPAHLTIGSGDNYLKTNTIFNINRDGIFIGHNCDDNEITDVNEISDITNIAIHVWRDGAQVITDNIINNADVGIKLRGSQNSIITGNTITLNDVGIEIEKYYFGGNWYPSQNNTIQDNTIADNTTYGMMVVDNDGVVVNASPNWWGHASGPYNDPYNTCGQGNEVIGSVTFMPWWADEDMTVSSGNLPVKNVTNSPNTYYCKIQDAVDDASVNQTIEVSTGTFNENVTIDVAGLIVKNAVSAAPVVQPTTGIAIIIAANNVTIEGFEISHATLDDGYDVGIYINLFNNAIIQNNLFTNNSCALALIDAGNNDVLNNTFTANALGIFLDGNTDGLGHFDGGGNGPFYSLSLNNDIIGNTIQNGVTVAFPFDDDGVGIYVDAACEGNEFDNNDIINNAGTGYYAWKASNNMITNNEISGNDTWGIELMGSSGNTITGNTLAGNTTYGINIRSGALSSTSNIITGNTITGSYTGIWLRDDYTSNNYIGTVNGNTISGNKIFNNTNWGIFTEQSPPGDIYAAENNWWGDATGPYRLSDNSCGQGNAVSDNVDICMWYTDAAMTPGDLNGCVVLIFNVTGGGEYCFGGTGVLVGLDDSEVGVNYQLYEGVNLIGIPVAGDGDDISFGYQTAGGIYTIKATNTYTGCSDVLMTGSATVTINPLPAAPTAGNVNVVYDGLLHTGTATAPTGSSVEWYDAATGGNISVAPSGTNVGVYTAWAESVNDVTGCISATRTEVTVTITPVTLGLKVLLQGPYAGGGLMNTDLYTTGQIPTGQPYSVTPWGYFGMESEATPPSTAVDWVLVELRSNTTTMVGRSAALVNSDGTVNLAINDVSFPGVVSGSAYYIVIWHRNHMPVMSASAITVPVTSYDFTVLSNLYGNTNPIPNVPAIDLGSGVYGMIAGDVTKNGMLKYSGPNNDRGPIIARIVEETGSNNTNGFTPAGYWQEDVTMNSIVLYLGSGNDRGPIQSNLNLLTGFPYLNNTYTSVVPGAYSGGKDGLNEGPVDIHITETAEMLGVDIITNEFIANGMVDNIQFTLAWKTSDLEMEQLLGTLTSSFYLLPQGDVVEVDGINYLVYVSVTPTYLPQEWYSGETVSVMTFEKEFGQMITDRLWIADNEFTIENNGEYFVSNWGSDVTGIVSTLAVGIDTDVAGFVKMYPNPVNAGNLFLQVNTDQIENLDLEIWDMTGRLIKKLDYQTSVGTSTFSVDVSNFNLGVYIINVIGDKVHFMDRFIVK